MRRFLLVIIAALAVTGPARAWTWPASGPVLMPFSFDPNHPYAAGQHRGIDVGGVSGETILAPAGGVISFAGTVPGSGKSITILTSDGWSVTLTQLGSIAVTKGAAVAEGDAVGTIGPSGDAEVSGAYVQLGVRHADQDQGYVDPESLLPARPIPSNPIAGSTATAGDPGSPPSVTSAPVSPVAAPGDATTTASGSIAVSSSVSSDGGTPPASPAPQATSGQSGVVPAAPPQASVAGPTSTEPSAIASRTAEPAPVSTVSATAGSPRVAAARGAGADGTTRDKRPRLQRTATRDTVVRHSVVKPGVAIRGRVRAAAVVRVPAAVRPAEAARAVEPVHEAATVPSTSVKARSSGNVSSAASPARRPVPPLPASRPSVRRLPRPHGVFGHVQAPVSALRPSTRLERRPVHETVPQARRRESPQPEAPVVSRPDSGRGSLRWLAPLVPALVVLVLVVARRRPGTPAPLRMIGADDVAPEEDPGRSRLAIRGGASAPWPRGGLRSPVRRVRPLSPVARQRRPHGERHGRARNTRDGGRGPGREVVR